MAGGGCHVRSAVRGWLILAAFGAVMGAMVWHAVSMHRRQPGGRGGGGEDEADDGEWAGEDEGEDIPEVERVVVPVALLVRIAVRAALLL
jgi:hypothetical protein